MKISCVIPAYNEEKTIVKVIDQVKSQVDEIIVVDDASIDGTYELARKQNITVLKHIINRGQGAALKTGTEYAINNNADIITHFDADGQFIANDIKKIIEPIKINKADAVFGSRFLDDSSQIPFFKKRIIMPLARFVNKIFFNIKMTDPQSGFRAMSAKAASKIDWHQDRMAHCSEILFTIHKTNFRIIEVPITVVYHNFGQRFSGGIKILKDLFLAKIS